MLKLTFPSKFTMFYYICLCFVAAAPDEHVLLGNSIIIIEASAWCPCDVCVLMGSRAFYIFNSNL